MTTPNNQLYRLASYLSNKTSPHIQCEQFYEDYEDYEHYPNYDDESYQSSYYNKSGNYLDKQKTEIKDKDMDDKEIEKKTIIRQTISSTNCNIEFCNYHYCENDKIIRHLHFMPDKILYFDVMLGTKINYINDCEVVNCNLHYITPDGTISHVHYIHQQIYNDAIIAHKYHPVKNLCSNNSKLEESVIQYINICINNMDYRNTNITSPVWTPPSIKKIVLHSTPSSVLSTILLRIKAQLEYYIPNYLGIAIKNNTFDHICYDIYNSNIITNMICDKKKKLLMQMAIMLSVSKILYNKWYVPKHDDGYKRLIVMTIVCAFIIQEMNNYRFVEINFNDEYEFTDKYYEIALNNITYNSNYKYRKRNKAKSRCRKLSMRKSSIPNWIDGLLTINSYK